MFGNSAKIIKVIMGFKGKFFKRFKRRSIISSDASIDNTTIATKEVIPNTPSSEKKYGAVDPSPIRLPVLGLDPEGKTADEAEVPSTPKVLIPNNVSRTSPAHTVSTKSSSIKSEIETSTERPKVPSFADNNAQEKNILSDITGMTFGLVTRNSDVSESSKQVAVNGVVDNSDGKETFDAPSDGSPKVAIAPKLSSAEVEIQRASSLLEYTSAPVDIDEEMSSNNDTFLVRESEVKINGKVRSNDSKASEFRSVIGRGVDSNAIVDDADADQDGSKYQIKNDKVEEYRESSDDIRQKEQIKTNSSWVKDIEKHVVTKASSDEASKRSRQVSFDDESHHIEDDHYMAYEPYADEEDSSFDSSEDFDDDSQYYDEHYDHNDDIDEASYISGNSAELAENGGIWGWLCGYDNFDMSPGSIEDQNEDKSVGTYTAVSVDGEGTVHSDDMVNMNTGAPIEEGEEMMYKNEEFESNGTLSSTKMGRKLRVVSPAPKLLPSLLKKKEHQQEQPAEDQHAKSQKPKENQQTVENTQETKDNEERPTQDHPRDDQGFPVDANMKREKTSTSPTPFKQMLKHNVSLKQNAKKQQDAPDGTSHVSVSKQKQHESGKEMRQLEVFCKSHGGAENLVLRKYSSIPPLTGKYDVLVKVEVSLCL